MRTPPLLSYWKNATWIQEGLYVLMVMGNEEIELCGDLGFPWVWGNAPYPCSSQAPSWNRPQKSEANETCVLVSWYDQSMAILRLRK